MKATLNGPLTAGAWKDGGEWVAAGARCPLAVEPQASRVNGALVAGLLAALLVLAGPSLTHGHPLPPRALVVVDADDLGQLRQARQAVEAAGGLVQGMTPPSMLLVRLNPEADEHLVGLAGIVAVERGPVDAGAPSSKSARRLSGSKMGRVALAAWNQRLRAKSPAALRGPLPPELLGMDVLEVPAGSGGDGGPDPPPGTPGPRPTSLNTRYMCGDCVVTIFLTESDGSLEPSTENWTEAEEAQVTAEIQEGLSWLSDLVNTTYNGDLTFIYEWHYREPTKYEPIRTTATFPGGNAAAYQILQRRGYAGSTSGGRTFNSDQRVAYGADMACLVFVADSSADADGYFADGYIAYAYLGGPWMVQNYRNDGWGISRMNQVTAHEMGHIFWAGDEYAASGATASERYGYLSVLNGNAENGGVGGACIMNRNSLTVCKWTAGQWGLLLPDTPNDGTPDCFQYDAGGTLRRDQLCYAAHALDDDAQGASSGNGNGQADAGEIVELGALIRNDAYVQMRAVTGTLSTSSPHVLILDGTAAFGPVDYCGGQAATVDPFVFAVAPDAPDGMATFTVELTTAQGWHFAFTLDVPIAGGSPDVQPPAAPTGLAVTGTGDRWAALAWNHNLEPDLDHYNLYRSAEAGFGYTLIAQPSQNTFTDSTVLNGRTYYYKLSASDAAGNESGPCGPVSAALVDEPPTVLILSPEDGTAVDEGEELDFSATAADREDGTISNGVVWTSSLDGLLGAGASLSVTLEPGTHLISAAVTDSGGNTDTAVIAVTVWAANAAPLVTIGAPVDGETFTTEDSITFTALASDAEDGDLTATILWRSDRDGQLGTGGTLARKLSAGIHVITARVTDSAEKSATGSVLISVVLAPLCAPGSLRAAVQRGAVKLRWQDTNSSETGYRVERAPDTTVPVFVVIGNLPANTCTFKDLALPSGAYLYRVRAVRGTEAGPACAAEGVSVGKQARLSKGKAPHEEAVPSGQGAETAGPPASNRRGGATRDGQADGSARPSTPEPISGGISGGVRTYLIVDAAPADLVLLHPSGFAEIRWRFQRMYAEMRRSIRDDHP